jgi:subtilisin-like proprotein convertase family protein
MLGVSSVTVSSGTYKMAGNQIIWSAGPVARGSNATMKVTAKASTLGSFTYSSSVRSQDNDPNLANNFATGSAMVVLPNGVTENPTSISIPQFGAATPYPSSIMVSGFTNPVGSVTVTLLGFGHTFPKDVDVLLVSPSGDKVMLMSDAGAGDFVSGLNLTFKATASSPIPRGRLSSGTYFPADWDATSDLPSPAPAGPYSTKLRDFAGTAANGLWSLYVNDHGVGDLGGIGSGWILNISTEIERPSLTIKPSGSDVVVAWPTWATGFVLQGNADAADGAGWLPFTTPLPVVIGEENVVTNTPSSGALFFRLVR